jgi:hypothetical protein
MWEKIQSAIKEVKVLFIIIFKSRGIFLSRVFFKHFSQTFANKYGLTRAAAGSASHFDSALKS